MIATVTTPPTMMPVLAPDDDDDSPMLAAAWSFGAGVTTLSPVGFVETFPVIIVVLSPVVGFVEPFPVVVVVVVVTVMLAVTSTK